MHNTAAVTLGVSHLLMTEEKWSHQFCCCTYLHGICMSPVCYLHCVVYARKQGRALTGRVVSRVPVL